MNTGLRAIPFAVITATALVSVAAVLGIARSSGADLVVEPGMLGRLGYTITGGRTPDTETVGWSSGLTATAVSALAGWLVAAVALRWTTRPRLVFLAVTLAGFAGWGVMAFTHAETVEAALWLNGLHVAAGVPIIGGLAWRLPLEPGPRSTD